MRNSRSLALPCTLALWLAGVCSAGDNSWTLTGPEGGPVFGLAIHPTNPSVVLIGTSRGIARSVDSGATWSIATSNTLNPAWDIAFDPTSSSRVIAIDGYVHLSEDGGQTFQIAQGPEQLDNVARIAFGSNGTLYSLSFGGGAYRSAAPFATWTALARPWPANSSPDAIAVDPNNPLIVYVAIYEVGIYRSTDGGDSWSGPLTTGFVNPANTGVYGLAVDPSLSTRVFAATSAGIHRSTNSGTSWSVVDASPTSWIGFNPTNANQLTALRAGGQLMRSTDNGGSWPTTGFNLRTNGLPQARYFPGSATHLLITSEHGLADSTDNGNNYDFHISGLRSSPVTKIVAADDGNIFFAMNAGFGSIFRHAFNFQPLSVSAFASATSGVRQVNALSVSASNSSTIFAVNSGYQLIRTTNMGASWSAPHPAFMIGASADYLDDVQIAPSNALVAYVGRQVTGVWKTTNGGATFSQLTNSPPFISTIAINPADANVVYVGAGTAGDATGIYKTIDGGATWQMVLAPIASLYINSFAFDPVNSNIVYATAAGGVRKTTDGGVTWSLVDFGGSIGTNVLGVAMLIDPLLPTTMTLVGHGSMPGFLRTVDGGASWSQTELVVPGAITIPQSAVLSGNGDIIVGTSSASVAEYTVAPDLSVAISGLPAVFPQSSTVTGIFSVTNQGPFDSSAFDLTVALPFFLTPTVPNNCTFAAQILTCHSGVLRIGETRNFAVTLGVGTGSTQGGLSTTVLGHEGDPDTANNTQQFNFTTAELADLDVSITSSVQTIDRGDTTNVSITATNAGPSPSSNTQLTVQIPAGFTLENLASSVGACAATPSTVTCDLGTFARNSSVTVTFIARGNTAGVGNFVADFHGSGTDPDSNHAASRAITVRPVTDVGVVLSESSDPVTLGVPFQYVATVSNNGIDGGAVQFSFSVTGAVVAGASATGATCATTGNTVNCNMTLAPAATATVTIDASSQIPGIASATATTVLAGTDTVPSNNSATIGTNMRLVGDLSVEVADSVDPATVDTPFLYAVTVRNAGPNAGPVHVVIPVTLATVSAVTSTAANCTTTAASATCDIAALASGASAVINVTVVSAAAGNASASPTVTLTGFDPNPANNSASASTLVRIVGDLSVEVADNVDPATVDAPFLYTVTVRNAGPNAVPVHVAIPVTLATVSAATSTAATCTTTAASAACDIAALGSGASAVINVTVVSAAAGNASASPTVTLTGFDPNPANNSASASTLVRLVGDLSAELTDSADPVMVAVPYSYTATVRNGGPNAGAAHLSVPVTGATVSGTVASSGGVCTNTASAVECDFATLASGASATVTINVNTTVAGSAGATATVSFSGTDLVTTNNSVTAGTAISNPPPPPPTPSSGGGGGGGGGGRFDWLALALLGVMTWRQLRVRNS